MNLRCICLVSELYGLYGLFGLFGLYGLYGLFGLCVKCKTFLVCLVCFFCLVCLVWSLRSVHFLHFCPFTRVGILYCYPGRVLLLLSGYSISISGIYYYYCQGGNITLSTLRFHGLSNLRYTFLYLN